MSIGKVNSTASIKLVSGSVGNSAAKNALNSIRNGPVKAGVGSTGTLTKVIPKQPHLHSSEAPESTKQQKASAPVKKQRPATAQHNRPSSPGINGKIAQAPYKSYANTIKSRLIVSNY
jgi:hypothetical protein